MDLIDRSKLHPVDVVEGIEGKIVFTTRSYWAADVANAPTVEAIPIGWLENYITLLIIGSHSDHEPELEKENKEKAQVIRKMLKVWRKENGTN